MNRIGLTLSAVLIVASIASCNSYRYMRDTTPTLEAMREDYVRNHPGNRFNDDISVGRVRPGMSRLQVRVTWGAPDQVFVGDLPGVDEVWNYAENEPSRGNTTFQLHFDGELLRNVQVQRGAVQLTSTPNRRERSIESEILQDDPTAKPR